ncbi:MAG: carboxypeptidase regulatory-like domain-containing protein, partial [Pyrinomonadaceae bacterium]
MFNRLSVRIFALVSLFIVSTVGAFAQGTTSRITGVISDTAGAAVSGATVTIRREGSPSTLSTQTSDNGQYVFDLVQPGIYQVTVEKAGFKKYVSNNNPAYLNLPATVNAALEVGDVSAAVTVEGTAEQVQTSTSGNVGSTIDQKTLESLPIVGLRGRNPLDLLNYQPGVVVGSNTGGGVHVNGSRDRAFNFTLDGIDINESTAGGSNFTPLRPNPDSIQEFQIITSNSTAEQGRSSGAQVTLVTRSGESEFRGSVFEYYQTPRFLANEWERNVLSAPRGQFVQHIYGGSFGGPIPNFGFGEGTPFRLLRDKAFFFVNLQRLSATETRLAQRTVYTPQALAGNFRYVVGNVNGVPGRNAAAGTPVSAANPLGASVSASGAAIYPVCVGSPPTNAPCTASYNVPGNSPITLDPFIINLLRSYPAPNDFSRGDGLNTAGYNFNALQLEQQWDFVTRVDYRANDKNHFYVRYAQGEQNTLGDSVNGGLPPFPGFPNIVDTLRTPKNIAVNYRWSPTPKFTNEFIFGVSKFGFSFATAQPDPRVPFILNSVTDAFTNFAYNARQARTIQFVDNITMDFSPHVLKAGVNLRFGRQVDDRSSAGGQIEGSVGFGAGASSFTNFNIPAIAVANGAAGLNTTDRTLLQSTINNFIGRIGSFSQGFVVSP